jgi:hypothetical protein
MKQNEVTQYPENSPEIINRKLYTPYQKETHLTIVRCLNEIINELSKLNSTIERLTQFLEYGNGEKNE